MMTDVILSTLMAFSVSFLGAMIGTSFISRRNIKRRIGRMQHQFEADVARIDASRLIVEGKSKLKKRLEIALEMATSVKNPLPWMKFSYSDENRHFTKRVWMGDASNRYHEVGGVIEERENERSAFFVTSTMAWVTFQAVGVHPWSFGILILFQLFVMWTQHRLSKKQTLPQNRLLLRHFFTPEEYTLLSRGAHRLGDMLFIRYMEMPVVKFSEELVEVLNELNKLLENSMRLSVYEHRMTDPGWELYDERKSEYACILSHLGKLEEQQFEAGRMAEAEASPRPLPQSLSMRRTLHLKETVETLLSDETLSPELKEETEETLRRVEERLMEEKGKEQGRVREWQESKDRALVLAARQHLGMKDGFKKML